MEWLGLWHYWAVIILMMIGLHTVIARDNLVKKIMGLSIFQVGVIMFYVAIGKVKGGTAPIVPLDSQLGEVVYSSPLPHVLMLTAIVVGISTIALALALIIRIQDAYGTVEEAELNKIDRADDE